MGEEIVSDLGLPDMVNFHVPRWMEGISTIMVSYYMLLSKLPVIGMLNNVAVYIILMFIVLLFMLKDKRKKEMLILLPLVLSFFSVIAAPQIQNQPRYAFPIICSMPVVLAYYAKIAQED